MIDDIKSLEPDAVFQLLFTVYVHSKDVAVKLWLVSGFPVKSMPYMMQFHLFSLQLLSDELIANLVPFDDENHAECLMYMFANEIMQFFPHKVTDTLKLLSTEKLRAIAITRCTPTIKHNRSNQPYQPLPDQCMYWTSDFAQSFYFHLKYDDLFDKVRLHAAIIEDDLEWLRSIATEPTFTFTPSILRFAAKFGAIKCFRFLAINGCPFEDRTLACACMGNVEEIIQLCLENGCLPTQKAFRQSVIYRRKNVIEWLTRVHGVAFNLHMTTAAFKYGNWDYLVQGLEEHILPHLRRPEPDFDEQVSDRMPTFFMMLSGTDHPQNGIRIIDMLMADPAICHEMKRAIVIQSKYLLIETDTPTYFDFYEPDWELTHNVTMAAESRSLKHLAFYQKKGWIDTPDAEGLNTVIRQIVLGAPDMEMIKLLVEEFGSDVDFRDQNGLTPLDYCVHTNNREAGLFFISHGASNFGALRYTYTV